MIVLRANTELKSTFEKLIKTMEVNVSWNGLFVVIDNCLILQGAVRSLFFHFDSRKVAENIVDLPIKEDEIKDTDEAAVRDVINMILDLKKRYHTSILFISHDISVVQYVADRIAVMYLGKIVEEGNAEEVVKHPMHPYTKALISNCMSIDLDRPVKRIKIKGEIPSPVNPGPGCYFCKRCFMPEEICKTAYPEKKILGQDYIVYCHLAE